MTVDACSRQTAKRELLVRSGGQRNCLLTWCWSEQSRCRLIRAQLFACFLQVRGKNRKFGSSNFRCFFVRPHRVHPITTHTITLVIARADRGVIFLHIVRDIGLVPLPDEQEISRGGSTLSWQTLPMALFQRALAIAFWGPVNGKRRGTARQSCVGKTVKTMT